VVSTGWYVYNELPFTFWMKDGDARIAELETLFVRDFEEGLEGTSIKPGAIKCSTDVLGLTPDVEALLRASARVHLRTGLPITTHTDYSNEGGLLQVEIFRQEGVDMGSVVIGHCNQSGDLGYLERLIASGVYIGFDRCGIESPAAPLEAQMDNLAELCRRGYADHIVLSHDDMLFIDLMPSELLEQLIPHYPYGYLRAQMLPGLLERGVTQQQLDTMLVDNPRRYFSRRG
jgi:phosphotriesterase-related protein